jgi:hypothetical protein
MTAAERPATVTDELVTRRDVVVAVWEALDCESVGAAELKQIQRVVAERFGEGAVESPACLARVLADEGAQLRHPELLEFDSLWREARLSKAATATLAFGTFQEAVESIAILENLRKELSSQRDEEGFRELRVTVLGIQEDRLRVVGSSICSQRERAEAKEIAGWLDIWLRTPELFRDWLDLRRSSPQFRKLFG